MFCFCLWVWLSHFKSLIDYTLYLTKHRAVLLPINEKKLCKISVWTKGWSDIHDSPWISSKRITVGMCFSAENISWKWKCSNILVVENNSRKRCWTWAHSGAGLSGQEVGEEVSHCSPVSWMSSRHVVFLIHPSLTDTDTLSLDNGATLFCKIAYVQQNKY